MTTSSAHRNLPSLLLQARESAMAARAADPASHRARSFTGCSMK